MRLFVAVDLDDAVRAAVQRSTVALRQRLERLRTASRLGWVGPDRMHLTLVFLGEVSESIGGDIAARLASPVAVSPFSIRIGHVGMFPPSGRPRVLWLAVEDGLDELRRLHREVLNRLEGLEFAREARAFSPHLTLARFREPGTVAERQALADVELPSFGASRVDHVTLYQSRLSPKGPTYLPVRTTPLDQEKP
jgi:RNA 2',3'-cyclic 3'-phosphodiesterase